MGCGASTPARPPSGGGKLETRASAVRKRLRRKRRQEICNEDADDVHHEHSDRPGEVSLIAQYPKEPQTLKILTSGTSGNPLFEGLSEEQLQIVYGAMVEVLCCAGETVIEEGERGDLFYVVESGEFSATLRASGSEVVMRYQSATSFGELALLYNSPRRATITCDAEGKLWAIDRAVFNMIMVASNKHIIDRKYEYLKKAEFCSCLDDAERNMLATLCEEVSCKHMQHIWRSVRASAREGECLGALVGMWRTALPACNCQRCPRTVVRPTARALL